MTTEHEAFEAWHDAQKDGRINPFDVWQAACAWQREKDAEMAGVYARRWWSKHCATNKHMETTRAAHDDFCALQNKIRGITPLEPVLLCSKCKTPMATGVYIKQTYSGTPDFPGGEVVTQYAAGPGKLTDCMKCPQCGWSTT